MDKKNTQRNYTQDFIRTLAIFLVIILHISAYFMGDNSKQLNANFWAGDILDAFARICVPLFVMSSGFFLIKEEAEDIPTFFKKRTNKLLIPLVFWSLIYSEYTYKWHASLSNIVWSFLSGRPYYHLWFLFMLIGLYLVAPFINILYQKYGLGKMNTAGLVLLFFGFAIDMWQVRFGDPFFLLWFIPYLGYFILGHTLPQMKYNLSSLKSFSIYFVASVGLVWAGYWTLLKFNNSEYAFDYLSPLVIIASLGLYMALSKISMKESWLTRIGKYTLGIYVIHILFMEKLFQLTHMVIFGNGILDIVTLALATFILSWASVYVISKIPVLKKTV